MSTAKAEIVFIPNEEGIIAAAHVIIEGKNDETTRDEAKKELTKASLNFHDSIEILDIVSVTELNGKRGKYEGSASLPANLTVVTTKITPENILRINPNADSSAIFAYYQGLHPTAIITLARFLSFYKVIE